MVIHTLTSRRKDGGGVPAPGGARARIQKARTPRRGPELSDHSPVPGLIEQVENLRGSAFHHVIAGERRDNVLLGGRGQDRIRGHGGDDRVVGSADNDRMRGDAGTDECDGGRNTDIADASCEVVVAVP